MQIKKAMRRYYREARRALSDQERVQKSDTITRRLRQLPGVAGANSLLVYVSAGAEVNTHGLIAEALRAGIVVYTPVVQDEFLRWSRLRRFAELDLSGPHPVPKKLDLQDPAPDAPVIIPGVAFDRSGNRLGQGGGHFDQFLATHRGPKIGIAFDVQVADELPAEPHDIAMDFLITESGALKFED